MSVLSPKYFTRFYGRRKGRKLSKSGILALKAGSKYILEYDKFSENFLNFKDKIILEIGFGDGKNLINSAKQNPDTFYIGADPFLNTTVKCLKQILENGGKEYDSIINHIFDKPHNIGYDLKNEKYGDMFKMGVIDPLKVTKNALINAVSVATTILSTNAIVTNMRAEWRQ